MSGRRYRLIVAASAERSLGRLPEYEIDDETNSILVLRIDHRSDVYRPR